MEAIELHLNPLHELVMEEGDRDFRGIGENICEIVKKSPVPVIVKEVGFGLSGSVVSRLSEYGVEIVDIAGSGGTNFVEIEDLRFGNYGYDELRGVGNPGAYATITSRKAAPSLYIIGSGGIRTALDLVKSLVIGSDLTSISGEILSYLLYGSYDNADNYLESIVYKTRLIMCALGAKNISELRKIPYRVTGRLRELMYD